ncbi:phage tail protein [Rhodothalassium salexigens]|uniref:phage tail protein n=1 Tax=Rhodothalassium salexigens TaxID=1086 RepID=UPI0019115AC9|nr:tail fiber protein [Rhodothalassium salexigens]
MPDSSVSYIGDVSIFAGNFAPRDWMFCNGQFLDIASYSPLFAVIGTIYGGNGTTNFALPDLRGRVPVHSGDGSPGPGLTPIPLGARYGFEQVALGLDQMPTHSHEVQSFSGAATQVSPKDAYPAQIQLASGGGAAGYAPQADVVMGTTSSVGNADPIPNQQPSLGFNFIICVDGLFPPRS